MLKPFKVLSEKTLFEVPGRYQIISAELQTPENKNTVWTYLKAKEGVVVLPLDRENNVYLKLEWRLNRKDFVWELPGGWVEEPAPTAEQIKAAANRELQEEIGLKAKKLEELIAIYPFNHLANKFHLFLAQDLVPSQLPKDENEYVEIQKLSFTKAYDLVMRNQVPNGQLAVLFLLVKQRLNL